MKWTREPPTKPGMYWIYCDKHAGPETKVEAAEGIRDDTDEDILWCRAVVSTASTRLWRVKDKYGAVTVDEIKWWSDEPIQVPDPPTGD